MRRWIKSKNGQLLAVTYSGHADGLISMQKYVMLTYRHKRGDAIEGEWKKLRNHSVHTECRR